MWFTGPPKISHTLLHMLDLGRGTSLRGAPRHIMTIPRRHDWLSLSLNSPTYVVHYGGGGGSGSDGGGCGWRALELRSFRFETGTV